MPAQGVAARDSQPSAERPRWSVVLRAIREARSVTQDGWAARFGVSRRTVQRWEHGDLAPDTLVEAAIAAYCAEKHLFRTFQRGSLAGVTLSAAMLRDLLAEARLAVSFPEHGPSGEPHDRPASRQTRCRPSLESSRPPRLVRDAPARLAVGLPSTPSSFIGRQQEIATIDSLLATTRLLTMTGVGGTGKTRLALELARRVARRYPDGVRLVDLAPTPPPPAAGSAAAHQQPALLLDVVAAALDARQEPNRPLIETVTDRLQFKGMLLVLDNCEHVIAACAELVETLLHACPRLSILATSREPLGIGGEVRYAVPSLTLPPCEESETPSPTGLINFDAPRLFVERAREARPDFALTDSAAAAVAAICRQLDGIPLALEMAAARVAALSVEQIAARLCDRFSLLSAGSRTRPPRQQTLRATLDWSWDLLSEPERILLRRLSVFAGGWTLEAAEAVCAGDGVEAPAVLDLLARLVNKSLIVADTRRESVRYRLLESVRRYAEEHLAAIGEATAVRERHLNWCLALAVEAAGELGGPLQGRWLTELEDEHDNLRAALSWGLQQGARPVFDLLAALPRFWELRGHLHEGRVWLAQALALDGAPAGPRTEILHADGVLAYMQGEYALARQQFDACLALQQQTADARGIAETRGNLGRVALRQGQFAVARTHIDAGLALARERGDTPAIAAMQFTLGAIALRQADYPTARSRFEESLALQRLVGNIEGVANVLEELATVAGELGEHDRRTALAEGSLVLYRRLGHRGGAAAALGHLGMGAWAAGDHERALATLAESLVLYRGVGDRRGVARLLGNQALVTLSEGNHEQAAAWCRECLRLYHELGDAWAIARYLPVLAGTLLVQGALEQAAVFFGAAEALRERLGASLPPVVRPSYDAAVATLAATLAEPACTAAWAAGRALSIQQVIARALAQHPSDLPLRAPIR